MSKTTAHAIPAATVVVLRDHLSHGIEVFLVRRGQKMKFMAGAFVFPGGRLDESDRAPVLPPWITGTSEAGARFPDLDRVQSIAHYVAAVRELFEEAGILLARQADGTLIGFTDPAVQARFNGHRADVHSGQ